MMLWDIALGRDRLVLSSIVDVIVETFPERTVVEESSLARHDSLKRLTVFYTTRSNNCQCSSKSANQSKQGTCLT
jgi:hypothetical protein